MKTFFYLLCCIVLMVLGSAMIRAVLNPPYTAGLLRLLHVEVTTEIPVPIPTESGELPETSTAPEFKNDPRLAYLGIALCGLGSLGVYFLPTFVGRGKQERLSIFILNFFLGWSFLGWVMALIWAVATDTQVAMNQKKDLLTQLRELGRLHREGILSHEEFKNVKEVLIAGKSSLSNVENVLPSRNLKDSAPSFIASQKNKTGKLVRSICPHCEYEYQVRQEILGKGAICKSCKKRFLLNA